MQDEVLSPPLMYSCPKSCYIKGESSDISILYGAEGSERIATVGNEDGNMLCCEVIVGQKNG